MSFACACAAKASAALSTSEASPSRALSTLTRHSVAARTTARFAALGRESAPAQPAVGGTAGGAGTGAGEPEPGGAVLGRLGAGARCLRFKRLSFLQARLRCARLC